MYRVETRRVLTIIVASWLIFVGSPSPILSQEAGRPLALVHARVIDVSGGGHSANRETGKHDYDEPHQKAYSKLYKERGAKYLAGSATDVWGTMPGISLHTELAKLHEIGLTNREVLAAATGNFAEAFGWHHTGTVQPGRVADILVLNRNPLENLRHLEDIHLLIHSGNIIDRKALLENGRRKYESLE